MLNGKNIKILELLFQEKYSIDDFAKLLNLNPRTIRYNIEDLNRALVKHNLSEIKKDKDLFYLDKKEIFKIKKLISSNSTLTSIDRRDYLLTKLLLNHEIVLSHESAVLDVTRRTLNNDLLEIKKFLREYQLEIEAIPGKGVKVYGNSKVINGLLIGFFTKFLSAGINLKTIFKDILFSLVDEKKLETILFKTNILLIKLKKEPQIYSFYAIISIIILSFTPKEDKEFPYKLQNVDLKKYEEIKSFFKEELQLELPDDYISIIIEILKSKYMSDFELILEKNMPFFFDELQRNIFKDIEIKKRLKNKILNLIRISDFKFRFNISEKNIEVSDLPEYNLELFDFLESLLRKYFRSFETEDVILLTRFIQSEINREQKNNRKKIIIVDNSLNHFAGKKVGDFLEKIYNVEVIQYLPVYKLKYFLAQDRKVDMIVTLINLEFEVTDIPVYEIELKKFWRNFKLLEEE